MSQPKNLNKKVEYPPGVKDINEDISTDDLVRRLKDCALAFQNMNQEDDNARYTPLALHLPAEYFMEHSSQDVRVLTACCIADVFRVFAPEAPYKDPSQLKVIFEFFVEQLKGLQKPKEDNFKRYHFYLLENLSWVKTFNICLELEDNQPIIHRLFELMFAIISDDHTAKVKHFILDMLIPLINEADMITQELLELILWQIIEPKKSKNKTACTLARDLLKKTSLCLEPYIQGFFNSALILGKPEQGGLSLHLYELIYELNSISESILMTVLPQLEFKLKSTDMEERIQVTLVLAKLFSEKNSNLARENNLLWHGFIGRYNDIDSEVRLCVVRNSVNLLVNHPELYDDLKEQLRRRLHDNDENVRYEVIRMIMSAAKTDFDCVTNELLEFVKERTLDKKFKIRKEALLGLAQLYKEQEKEGALALQKRESVSWIRNKVFHLYYQTALEDRLLVERILLTCLVPYQCPVDQRMKKLYHLVAVVDMHAFKAIKELFRCQNLLRGHLHKLVEIINLNKMGDDTISVQSKIPAICKQLPESARAQEHILKFCYDMESNHKLRNTMFVILSGNAACSEVEKNVKLALKILGVSSLTNPYYMTIKQLLERVAPLMIDKEGIQILVTCVKDSLLGSGGIETELGISDSSERNMCFLQLLSTIFPGAFKQQEVFENLLLFLQSDDEICVSWTLQILLQITSDVEARFPLIANQLIPMLESFAETGTVKQAKYAIYCLNTIILDKQRFFGGIIENLKKHLTLESQYFRTSLVSIGHIAFLCHNMFANQLKKIVAQVVVKDLLNKDKDLPRGGDNDWGPLEALPDETKAKIAGMKLMIQWLMGLKNAVAPVVSTLRLLSTIVVKGGDLMQRQHTAPQENSWLRLTAATCILKLCQEANYIDSLGVGQFQILASVMNDSCVEVRERFAQKLHKGLMNMKLPIEFMAMFALCGIEEKKEHKAFAKSGISHNILKRRDYLKQHAIPTRKLLLYLPDYVLPYVIYLLAHAPFYEAYNDVNSLSKIQDCLWFIMEHLVVKNENHNFNFLKKLLENIKQTKDQENPEDHDANLKIYAVTDLAMSLLLTKTTNIVLQDLPVEPTLPPKLFTTPDKQASNTKTYLPREMVSQFSKKSKFEFGIFMDREEEKEVEVDNPDDASRSTESPVVPTSTEGLVAPTSAEDPVAPTSAEDPVAPTSIEGPVVPRNTEGPVAPIRTTRTRPTRRNKGVNDQSSVADSNSVCSTTTNSSLATTMERENGGSNETNHLSAVSETDAKNKRSKRPMRATNHISSKEDATQNEHSDSSAMIDTASIVDSNLSDPLESTITEGLNTSSTLCEEEEIPSTRHKTLRLRSKRSSVANSEDIPPISLHDVGKNGNPSPDNVPKNLLKDCNVASVKENLRQSRSHQRKPTDKTHSSHEKTNQNNLPNSRNSHVTRQKRSENISKTPAATNHQTEGSTPTKKLRSHNAKDVSVALTGETKKPIKRTKADTNNDSPPNKRVTRQKDGPLPVTKNSTSPSKNSKTRQKKKKV